MFAQSSESEKLNYLMISGSELKSCLQELRKSYLELKLLYDEIMMAAEYIDENGEVQFAINFRFYQHNLLQTDISVMNNLWSNDQIEELYDIARGVGLPCVSIFHP